MQVLAEYEREIGHPGAEPHAAQVATIRKQIAAAQADENLPGEPDSDA